MSTKSTIWHSGEYVDGVPHYYMYWEMNDHPERVHLDYRDETGHWTEITLPKEMIDSLKRSLLANLLPDTCHHA